MKGRRLIGFTASCTIMLGGGAILTGYVALAASTCTVTTAADSGSGSLRDCLTQANATPGAWTISFSAATDGTPIIVASNLPSLGSGTTLILTGNGAGATIVDGSGSHALLSVGGPTTVNSLTLRNGFAAGPAGGAAIHATGSLTVDATTFEANTAEGGGAIATTASLTISGSTFVSNTAAGTFGGAGGAILTSTVTGPLQSLTVDRSIFSANKVAPLSPGSGGQGGAISSDASQITITNTGFNGNVVQGGGAGGAIASFGTLTVGSSTFTGNAVTPSGSVLEAARGGAISSSASIDVSASSFSSNAATGTLDSSGGAIDVPGTGAAIRSSTFTGNSATSTANYAVGGGIASSSSATIVNSIFNGNRSSAPTTSDGGALYLPGLSGFTIDGSSLVGNSAIASSGSAAGGAVYQDFGSGSITNSTLDSNTADGQFSSVGGAAELDPQATFDTVTDTLTGDTFSRNSTHSSSGTAWGGAIDSQYGETLVMTNDTITSNSASGSRPAGGGIADSKFSATSMTNLTVAANSAGGNGDELAIDVGVSVAITGTILTGGHVCNLALPGPSATVTYSIDSDTSCGLAGAGDLSNTDPMLGVLQNNGGPTFTMALLAGSPAIDADGSSCPPPTTDQRGLPRPDSSVSHCDIGAYEVQSVVATPPPTAMSVPVPATGAVQGEPTQLVLGLRLLVLGLALLTLSFAVAARSSLSSELVRCPPPGRRRW
jgi:predicted outer membrane repeat protein